MGVILRYKDILKTYKTRGHRLRVLEKYKKVFPISSSPLLAGLIGSLIGDGHLQREPKWRMDFTSKNRNELKNFGGRIELLFEVNGKIRECTSNNYSKSFNIGINCSPVARILFLVGVPAGQKVLTKFKVPKWIISDKECFREFCRYFFGCEGTIMNDGRKIPQIRLEHWKSESLFESGKLFVEEICLYLEKYFGINTTITSPKQRGKRTDGIITRPIKIYIFGDSVIKFCKEIKFSNHKQKSLKALLAN